MSWTSSRARRRYISVALGATLLASVSVALPGSAGTSAASTTTCVVTPTIRDVTINQGLPYGELTAGKDTLVRLFLEKPKCADKIDVQLTGASIDVTGGATPASLVEPVPALQDGDDVYPVVAPSGTFPVDHPGDPVFAVPGTALTGTNGGAFSVSVSARLAFRWRSSTSDPWLTGTTPLLTTLANGTAMKAAVGPATKPLRVLVVPMGDLSQGMAAQFPPAATAAIENGMQALSRLMPVSRGVSDLLTVSGGLRYRIVSGMVDLGPLGLDLMPVDTDGVRRFCGTTGNFPEIGRSLSAYLVAWNTANPAFAADRAIGAIWEGVSKGPTCAEGVGSFESREGWVRAIADVPATATTAAVPSRTGALLGMELQHTFGGIASDAENHGGGGHSKNTDADGGTQRAYHVTDGRYIPDDRTLMRYRSTGWDNTNTVMERPDWDRARCVLNPPPPPEPSPCPSGGLIGTAAAGSGASIVVSGATDGTPAGTGAHSYVTEDVQRTPPVDSSAYTLVQLAADGRQLQVDRFVVGGHHGDHTHDGNDEAHTALGEFDIAVAFHPDAFRFQLRRDTTVLYERVAGDVPELVATTPASPTGEPIRVTDAPGHDELPTLSRDGELLAWQDGSGVRIRRRAGGAVASVPGATQPALSADLDPSSGAWRLSYVVGGDLYVADVTLPDPDAAPRVAGNRRIYDRSLQTLAKPSASHPSFSGDADVAVAINDDLWVIDTDFVPSLSNPLVCQVGALVTAPCRPLTTTLAVESRPSWGSGDLVAYERDGDVWTLTASTVPGGAQTRRVTAAGDPSLGGNALAFTRGDALLAVSATTFTGEVPLVGDAARAASLTADGRTLAYDQPVDGQREVFLLPMSAEGDSFVVRHPRAAELRADLWAVTAAGADPVVVAVPPTAVDGDLATFTLRYDSAALRPGSIRRVQVSDGWSTTVQEFGPPEGEAAPPIAAVYAPSVGMELTEYEAIPLTGSAKDADGNELDGSHLRWFHLAPGATTPTEVGTGARVSGPGITTVGFLDPPLGGWPVGLHTVTLRATDAQGLESETSVTFEILEDADRDGRPATTDVPCSGSSVGGDDDPYDAFADSDRDGLLDGEDPNPCSADVNVKSNFDPDHLYVPSSGNPVTVYFTGSDALAGVAADSVRIVQLGYERLDVPIPASSWAWDKRAKAGVAKFDRLQLTNALHQRGLVGGWVPIVVTGAAPTFSFRGVDPAAPIVFPAS